MALLKILYVALNGKIEPETQRILSNKKKTGR
jgi:hypothetical protein